MRAVYIDRCTYRGPSSSPLHYIYNTKSNAIIYWDTPYSKTSCSPAGMDSSALAMLACSCTAIIVSVLLPWLSYLWRYRNIPGPLPLPVVGNALSMLRMGLPDYLLACSEKYGKTFKVSVGSRRIIVTADPKVARHVTSHAMNRNLMPSMRVDDGTLFFQHGLFGARYACSQWGTGAACNSPPVHLPNPYPDAASYNREEKWHTLRPAWQPAFQKNSLEAYADCMNRSAVSLAEQLSTTAGTGCGGKAIG